MKTGVIILLVISVLLSCERETPEFYTTIHGLKYKYHDVSLGDKSPREGDVILAAMQWKTQSDSVFYDSRNYSPDGIVEIKMGRQKHLGGIEEAFSKFKQGDSVSIFIEPKMFYSDYLNIAKVPEYLKEDSEMEITMRIVEIKNQKAYEIFREEQKDKNELNELKQIRETISEWKNRYNSINEKEGVYWVVTRTNTIDTARQLKYGDIILLDYTASFLNGQEFYNTYKNGYPDEFQLGKEKQMAEGLQDVILQLKQGEEAMVLVPSYRGFTSTARGIIPPYTPVIYNIKVNSPTDNE